MPESRPGSARAQRNHVARAIRQDQQVAPAQLPHIGGGILDGRRVLGGHQRANIGQVGEQRRGPGQGFFLLRLEALVVGDGVAHVLANVFADPLPHAIADDEQRRRGQAGGNRQERQQEISFADESCSRKAPGLRSGPGRRSLDPAERNEPHPHLI